MGHPSTHIPCGTACGPNIKCTKAHIELSTQLCSGIGMACDGLVVAHPSDITHLSMWICQVWARYGPEEFCLLNALRVKANFPQCSYRP